MISNRLENAVNKCRDLDVVQQTFAYEWRTNNEDESSRNYWILYWAVSGRRWRWQHQQQRGGGGGCRRATNNWNDVLMFIWAPPLRTGNVGSASSGLWRTPISACWNTCNNSNHIAFASIVIPIISSVHCISSLFQFGCLAPSVNIIEFDD